jgi:glycosyltransferase involved in cell wall biosynthesis
VIAISHEIKFEEIRYFQLPDKKVVLINNGIDLEPFENFQKVAIIEKKSFRSDLGIMIDELVILQVARIEKYKGQNALLSIFQSLLKQQYKIKLIFVGSGNYETPLKSYARAQGLENSIVFAGHKNRDEVIKFFNIADVVALPSINEGSPLSLIEAMAMAKPVVAYTVGEIGNVISDNITGLLVDSGNEIEFKNKIKMLLDDDNLRKSIGSAAQAWALQHCTIERMVEEIIKNIYKWE